MTELTEAQRDGIACIVCGRTDRPMVPVSHLDGGQLFACSSCSHN